jgi:uncharacterized protein (TIGR02722 family)
MAGLAFLFTGCAAFRASTEDVNINEERHFGARFDATDMRSITARSVDTFLNSEFLAQQPEPPILMIAGVQNRTNDHVDTKNITDRIRTMIFKTGSVRFVNEARRADLLEEQGYQAANVTPGQQVAIGRQLGAKYMFSGSLTEIKTTSPRQVRVSKQELRNYKFTLEVTDLESGEIAWIDEIEFARQASKPLIGW